MQQQLNITPRMLAVFIDETGNEDFSDPNFPIFGRGGCAIIGSSYQRIIEKPWHSLKKQILGTDKKHFHTVEFAQTRPNKLQIEAINTFVKGKFHRFFAYNHKNTNRSESIDGHKAVSISLIPRIQNIAKKSMIDSVALIFENSKRGNTLVERDINLSTIKMINAIGQKVETNGYFLDKKSMTAGLELANLIVHTAGRQARLLYKNHTNNTHDDNIQPNFNTDYNEVFLNVELGLPEPEGIFVTSITQNN